MLTEINNVLRVKHTKEELGGVLNHVVRIYAPHGYVYVTGRWPVTETETSLDAIWSGVFEAEKYVEQFNASTFYVYSTDAEAFAVYSAEVLAYE